MERYVSIVLIELIIIIYIILVFTALKPLS